MAHGELKIKSSNWHTLWVSLRRFPNVSPFALDWRGTQFILGRLAKVRRSFFASQGRERIGVTSGTSVDKMLCHLLELQWVKIPTPTSPIDSFSGYFKKSTEPLTEWRALLLRFSAQSRCFFDDFLLTATTAMTLKGVLHRVLRAWYFFSLTYCWKKKKVGIWVN